MDLRAFLPPVSSLAVFEAAARLSSFTAAARELGMSQAGVSRHIQQLEQFCGAPLFRRKHRGVSLTKDGERLHESAVVGMNRIASTVRAIRGSGATARVTLATTIAFASLWLMPRLRRLHAAHPDIEVSILAIDSLPDMENEGIDLLVRFGFGNWPNLVTRALFDDEMVPVCSPSYAFRQGLPRRPEQLLQERLLQMQLHDPSWVDWTGYLTHFGVQVPPILAGSRFNNYLIALQAAVAGEGIALGWKRLLGSHLAERLLIPLPVGSMPIKGAYYLARHENSEPKVHSARIEDWLCSQDG
jgi:LysR family transcriptional regulator, glycine cleavage system transcriptional activator